MEKLYILDGMALLYRSFYAFINAPMRTSAGVNTSAIFGFTNTVISLTEKGKPTHIAVCFDASEPTFRHEKYPLYKATRQAMPQELRDSVQPVLDILHAMRITTLRQPGVEADDIIGTITRMAEEKNGEMHAYMVSADKDLGQLLSAHCSLYKPGKKGTEFETVGAAEFCREWGIDTPRQIIDMLALMGDKADNIPGVPGVGAVTASKLIARYGSAENLLAGVTGLKGKIREKIEQNADLIRLSYDLATIRRDVPLHSNPDDYVCRPYNEEELLRLLGQFELRGPAKRLGLTGALSLPAQVKTTAAAGTATTEKPVSTPQQQLFATPQLRNADCIPHRYSAVEQDGERQALADRLSAAKHWAFCTYGTTEDRPYPVGLAFCPAEHEAYCVRLTNAQELEIFRPALEGNAQKIGVNLKADLRNLIRAGVRVQGPFFDGMLAHAALRPELRHGLAELAEGLLGYTPMRGDAAVAALCAAEQADLALQLQRVLAQQLEQQKQTELMQEIEFPLLSVLAEMEEEGMRLAPALLKKSSAELARRITAVKERIRAVAGHSLNLNSPQQIGELLFDEMHLLAKPKKTRSGQYVTDEETLRRLAGLSPIVGDILEYRELSKLKGTYLDALPRYVSARDGRIHSTLLQMETATGRLASQAPNLQNIPVRSAAGKFIRRAFVARARGWSILSVDYSQIELRIMAALSADPALCTAFRLRRDIHAETAARIYGVAPEDVTDDMRRRAKTVNFGIIYGISSFGLAQRLGCTRIEAAELIASYFRQFPQVKVCMEKLVERARARGYAETLCGRRRNLPDIKSPNFNLRTAAERTAINTPIQGSAADMIKLAMVRVANLLRGRRSRMIMQIHDELVFDLQDAEADELVPSIKEAMCTALPLPGNVPAEVEAHAAANWLDAH